MRIVTPVTAVSALTSTCRLRNPHRRRRKRFKNFEPHIVQIEETSVPNRRRHKISTAMSAVAALAVA
ncbi:MAG: hypothetical protein FGM52_11365, partial [Mycobacterium sp.]|nr:hypothetical protein [Mycobacterium sp.]